MSANTLRVAALTHVGKRRYTNEDCIAVDSQIFCERMNDPSLFTLRLDNERHLKLRLASALCNRSAQQLVTEALDAFLESIAEVDDLARQVAARDVRQPGG